MTEEVAELVLDDNRDQTLALTIARHQSLPMVNVHARYLDLLEAEGLLDRALEHLPTDKQIAERQSLGSGLERARVRGDDRLHEELRHRRDPRDRPPRRSGPRSRPVELLPVGAAPPFPDALRQHRLRREIIATTLVNSMVNLAGISFDHRMTEDTGSSVADVARAFLAARSIVGSEVRWVEIDAIGDLVPFEVQIDLFLDARRMAERAAGWILRHRPPNFDVKATIDAFGPGISNDRELARTVRLRPGRRRDRPAPGGSDRRRRPRGPGHPLGTLAAGCIRRSTSSTSRRAEGCPDRAGGHGLLVDLRGVRPDVAVGGHRTAPAFGPLADPGAVGTCATICCRCSPR